MEIVTVNISDMLVPKPKPIEYAILCDRTAHEVLTFARKHPGCYIFPFITKLTDDGCPSYRSLGHTRNRHVSQYIITPLFIGGKTPLSAYIRQYIESVFVATPSICVYNESPLDKEKARKD